MEIGSIFAIDPYSLLYNSDKPMPKLPIQNKNYVFFQLFNTGRSAIEALLLHLKTLGYKKVYLPSFLCDSVRDAALRASMELEYYPVNKDLSIEWDTLELQERSVLYVVQFFGQTINDNILDFVSDIKYKGIKIIEDISLSLLSYGKTVGFGDYIIGSLRKWFPIVDGGMLLSREPLPEFVLFDAANDYTLNYFVAQILKLRYLESVDKNSHQKDIYLSYNADGMDALFRDYSIRKMSKLSIDLLKTMNYAEIAQKRIDNYDTLCCLIDGIPQIQVLVDRKNKMVPLGMVILVDERDRLFKYLIENEIYCNIHWKPNNSTMKHTDSNFLSEHCITIPCDQRYGKKEIDYIYEKLKKYYGVL